MLEYEQDAGLTRVRLQGLPIHLDGARVFNAAEASGVDVAAIAEHVTSVQFCLSKVQISGQCAGRNF